MMKRHEIIARMANIFDYSEFIKLCKQVNVEQLGLSEWASKVKIYAEAVELYPEDPPLNAYLKLVDIENWPDGKPVTSPTTQAQTPDFAKECGTCGGGKIR